jgi:isopentenyldiphosphate isomerase
MTDELVDMCDENNNLIGLRKLLKSEAHKNGLWHRAAHIWIYNSKGELLLQLRAKGKLLYPDMWDISAAGHVSAGEEPLTSGLRELAEELGLKARQKDLQFFGVKKIKEVYKQIKNNEFDYIYFLKFDGDIKTLKLQAEEVQEIRFLPLKKIEEELKDNPNRYVPHGDYWTEVIEEVKRRSKE